MNDYIYLKLINTVVIAKHYFVRNKVMIIGAHSIIYSQKPDADSIFFKDVLNLPNVDVGGGWLIFGLPPSELAVHPSKKNSVHELYLMCNDIRHFAKEMGKHKIKCSAVQDRGWGLLIQLTLPGGGKIGVYEPKHGRPKSMRVKKSVKSISNSPKKVYSKSSRNKT
jgi:hypothetical protein